MLAAKAPAGVAAGCVRRSLAVSRMAQRFGPSTDTRPEDTRLTAQRSLCALLNQGASLFAQTLPGLSHKGSVQSIHASKRSKTAHGQALRQQVTQTRTIELGPQLLHHGNLDIPG